MSDPFIGEIRLFGFNFNPRGWALCSGALLSIAQNSTLFSLFGTTYGGDGRTTFALPDLRGRAAMNKGRHPGSFFDWRMGQKTGTETHTLTIPELASHSHFASFTATGGSASTTVTFAATTEDADIDKPSTNSYLALGKSGRSNVNIYKASPTAASTVDLGGVTVTGGKGGGGTVTVGANGGSAAFSIIQPVLALNYCLAIVGLYPPRS